MNKVKKFFYSQKAAPYVFILPFVLTILLFWIVPIANGVLLSFQDVLKEKWVGFNNYSRLVSDKMFYKAIYNSVKYMIGTLILLIPFPMLFASLLNSKLMKGAKKISTRFMYVLILHFPKVIKIINIATAKSVRIFNPNGSTGSRAVRLKSPPTILPIITLKYFIFEPMIFFVSISKK